MTTVHLAQDTASGRLNVVLIIGGVIIGSLLSLMLWDVFIESDIAHAGSKFLRRLRYLIAPAGLAITVVSYVMGGAVDGNTWFFIGLITFIIGLFTWFSGGSSRHPLSRKP